MEILIIGGFLGGGKTTVVNKLLREMDAQNLRVAVVENEIGTSGVDQAAMEEVALSVTPMFGGCVCCQLAGKFQDTVEKLRVELNPDWVVVELSGLALMKDMRACLKPMEEKGVKVHAVGIADAARWKALSKVCPMVLENQLQNVDLVLLNKTDLVPATEELLESVRTISCGDSPVLPVSAIDAQPLWETMKTTWRCE